MVSITSKRVIIITGHYGSGKTNFAINLALDISHNERVCLADLDIVNPYFRAADSKDILEKSGVQVLAPIYAGSNLDIPALPPQFYSLFTDKLRRVILDVGGDDAGAAALGQYAKIIKEEDNFEHLYVINARRALTQTPEDAVQILHEIEAAGHVPITAIVNNTNLSNETDAGIVRESVAFANEVSRLSSLPIKCTTVKESIAKELSDIENIYPVKIYVKTPWQE
ncbi:ParA family protein [[Clostridium] cellulosi]